MHHLVIDIGNTFSKVALFHNRTLIQLLSIPYINSQIITEFVNNRTIKQAILSTVKQDISGLEHFLISNYKYLRFNTALSTSVSNHYKTPQTLGLDRFAAIIGAAETFKGENCLVIDAGTCITYDFVDAEKNYFGGSISPGITMRFKAMHAFTNKLPLLEFTEVYQTTWGTDTKTAMLSGVQQGVLHEVTGFIQTYINKYPNLKVLLCGGDADFFDTQLKNSIFAHNIEAVPNLVLIGLNEVIHQYND